MLDKYIELTNQLIQGYHIENNNLEDLEEYFNSHLRNIKLRKLNNFLERNSLVVLDQEKGIVSTYDWEGRDEDIETYIDEQGHTISNCNWGVFKNTDIDIVHEVNDNFNS